METNETTQAGMAQANTEQRLAVRDAQFAVVAAKELVQTRQNELMQVVQNLAKALGYADTDKMNFDLSTLEFKHM